MSFYIRKSVNLGPIRLTLSKSGVNTSVGVKGFRVGAGPRGTYVHVGTGGLYYRQTQSKGSPLPPEVSEPPTAPALHPSDGAVRVYGSADVSLLEDTRQSEVLNDLNTRAAQWPLLPVLLSIGLLFALWFIPQKSYSILGAGFISPLLSAAWVGGFFGLVIWTWIRHRANKTTLLLYDLEPDAAEAYRRLHDAVESTTSCSAVWSIDTKQGVSDWKRNAGASHLIQRKSVRANIQNPPNIRTNVSVPRLPAKRQEIYFLPDRLLILQGRRFASIGYDIVHVDATQQRFIEELAPHDATVVDKTYRYVNKNGGPDRRFKNNAQLPVCLYGQLHLSSSTGMDEMYQFSQPDPQIRLAEALADMARTVSQPSSTHSLVEVTSEAVPSKHSMFGTVFTTTPTAHILIGTLVSAIMVTGIHIFEPSLLKVPQTEASVSASVPTLHIAWNQDELHISATPPRNYEFGMAETGAPNGNGWMQEDCIENNICHNMINGRATIHHVDAPNQVSASSTLFQAKHTDNITYILRDGSTCWAGGQDTRYYQRQGCRILIISDSTD